MRKTPAANIPMTEFDDWDDAWDFEDAKEVYFPDDPSGELSMIVRLRFQFEYAGYKVRTVEKPSPYHPVWLVKGIRQAAPQFFNDAQFIAHVLQILRSADIHLRKADVTAELIRDRIFVSFLWSPPVAAAKRKARLRRRL